MNADLFAPSLGIMIVIAQKQKLKGTLVLSTPQDGVDLCDILKGGAGMNTGLILPIVVVPGIINHQVTMTLRVMLDLLQVLQLQLL